MNTQMRSYREAEILSSTPEQLVPLFYRELLRSLRAGQTHIEKRAIEEKAEELGKARSLLLELLGALKADAGGELSQRLASLYSYFLREIDEASRELDPQRLTPIIEMVTQLEEAWRHAAEQMTAASPEPTQPPVGRGRPAGVGGSY